MTAENRTGKVKNAKKQNFFLEQRELLAVLAVSMLALLVRLYQLGTDSLWFDEIGVALAIRSANLSALLESVRSHVMAMPLDYFVDWLLIRSCHSEACLRLPAALWGALTIPISFLLFRRLVASKIAVLGALLLALFPLHIQYSQELRFYTSLTFFYILSTLMVLRAIEIPSFKRWLGFVLVITIGSYFHIYAWLAFINGFAWVLSGGKKLFVDKRIMAGLLGSFFAASFAILPGYFYFRSAASYGMFSFAEAIINIMIGLGWLPPILFPLQAGFFWYPLFLYFQLIGLKAIWKLKNQMLFSWFLSSLLQAGIIFLVNVLTTYPLRGRQLLILMPFLCLLGAEGIFNTYQEGYRIIGTQPEFRRKIFRPIYLFCCVAIGITILTLNLQSFYHLEKSSRKEISNLLIQRWEPGEEIWFTPAWENKFFGYYTSILGHPEMEKAFIGVDQASSTTTSTGPVCWVMDSTVSPDQWGIIQKAGLKEVTIETMNAPDTQLLFCR
jgi:uncharacterized membrane protein